MSADHKSTFQTRKWAVVTLHRKTPSETEQVARARAWGIEKQDLEDLEMPVIVVDDVRDVDRTTNWMAHLTGRFEFIDQLAAYLSDKDDVEAEIFFSDPLCVGFSARLAEETINRVWDAGASVYVHATRGGGAALYKQGDDISEFLRSVSLAQNAAAQQKFKKARQGDVE